MSSNPPPPLSAAGTAPQAQTTAPTVRPGIASRLFRRTTDLVVIGLLLATCLTAGRQVVQWWREEPVVSAPAVPPGVDASRWGTADVPLLIEFGDFPVRMRQEILAGEPDEAWYRLQERVREALTRPAAGPAVSDEPPPENQQRLLKLASALEPAERVGEVGAVFRFAEWFVGAFAVRLGPGATFAERVVQGRLVAWGLLVPSGTREWRIYQFEPTSGGGDEPWRIPPPPGGVRLLATADRPTGGLLAYRGRGTLADWQGHFDGWFQGHSWQVDLPWEGTSETSGARYVRTGERGLELAEIRLVRDNEGRMNTVVQIYEAGD